MCIDLTSSAPPRVAPELAAALARAQAEFGPLPKAKSATVQTRGGATYRYSYSDLAATLEAVRQPLARHELCVLQLPSVRQLEGGGCLVGCETLLVHSSGASVSAAIELPVVDASPQSVGSALTYARRYGLSALLAVAGEDEDDDAQGAQPKAQEPRQQRERRAPAKEAAGPKVASEAQRKLLWTRARARAAEFVAEGDAKDLAESILRAALPPGLESSRDVLASQVDDVLRAIDAHVPEFAR